MKLLKALIISLILMLPFGQLTRLPLAPPTIHIYVHDLMVVCIGIVWLVLFIKGKKRRIPPLARPISYFTAAILLSLAINLFHLTLAQQLIAMLYGLRWIGYSAVYCAVYLAGTDDNRFSHRVLTLLSISGAIIALLGLMQYMLYPNLRNLMYLGWDPHQYRLFGTYLDAGFTGIMLVLTLILLTTKSRFPFQRMATAVVYAALILTYARSAYATAFAALAVYSSFFKSFKIILIGTIVLLASILILPRPAGEGVRLERTATIVSRMNSYQQALSIIKDHPLFGVGFNAYRFAGEEKGYLAESNYYNNAGAGTDSSLLFVLATSGVIGFTAYINLIYAMMRTNRNNPLIIISIIALLINSAFLNSLFYPWVMLWLWLILGVRDNAGNRSLVAGAIFGNNLK